MDLDTRHAPERSHIICEQRRVCDDPPIRKAVRSAEDVHIVAAHETGIHDAIEVALADGPFAVKIRPPAGFVPVSSITPPNLLRPRVVCGAKP